MHRREFLAALGGGLQATSGSAAAPLRLGIDLFSIRSQRWSPFELLDYCARSKVQVAFFSEERFLGGLDEDNLRKVRAHADKAGVAIEVGMRSICPTSKMFDAKDGPPEQRIAQMLAVCRTVGSPILRAVLGSSADRATDGGIERHIENTVRVLRSVRSRVVDAGLRMAIENHAGDMQARELKMLIEAAGKDFVGACLDSGNPLWAIEDPHLTLETLAPYTLTTHVRDSYLWRTPEGVAVRWTRTGDGNVDIQGFIRKLAGLCPGRTVALEVIVTGPRIYRCFDPAFWKAYRNTPAWEFSRFLALAERGQPQTYTPPPRDQAPAREREDLEASLQWMRGNA
jgi:3-oxoisoapionate decarboxylase